MTVTEILLYSTLAAVLTLPVFGKLSSPQNVKMHSINFKNVLKWSPVTYRKGNVHYSVEYQTYYDNNYNQKHFEKGCTNISVTECDLSNELAFGAGYYLRVRAEYKDETSDWTSAIEFEPSHDTVIGAPLAVIVKPRLDMLDVHISEPVNENNNKSMHEYFLDLGYNVSYWEDTEERKIESTYIQQKTITLTNLKPWTTYCLEVKPFMNNRSTQSSSVTCETTKDDGRVADWKIVVVFLASLCVVFLVIVGIFYASLHGYRIIRYIFFPSYKLPEHIKQFLKEPWLNSPFLPPQTNNLPEEPFDKLIFLSNVQECLDNTDIDIPAELDMLQVHTLKKENEDEEKQAQYSNTNFYARTQTLPKSSVINRNMEAKGPMLKHSRAPEASSSCTLGGTSAGGGSLDVLVISSTNNGPILEAPPHLTAVISEVLGEIKPPTNIRIQAFNMKYVLKWDDAENSNYTVNYTVNYKSSVSGWRKVKGCENIIRRECDFSSLDIIFSGEYFLRLQARHGNQTTAWLSTDSFIPDKNNVIGPPSVHVESGKQSLTIEISEMLMSNNASIRTFYKDIQYRVTYWKENSYENAHDKNSTERVIVLTLEPWTTYCLHVLAFSSVFSSVGLNSSVVCKRTGGDTPKWLIGICFLVSLVVFFIGAVGCILCVYYMYRCTKYALFPPHTLPEHLQECFSESSQRAPFHVLTSVEDSEECCDPLIVITENNNLSSWSSSFISKTENEQQNQSSQTSADSGRFSNAESSRNEDFNERTFTELDLQT
ncbi:interferon alpha/beta receptor 1-like [Hypanus sabinus]|uniref:interferon alpha/beta receptor 1-like n=1 Tax=Hypanus sabinus TaxID=79690 RepID=UPI0028C3B36B|nr:interferon alpha/beta receptor 1-like [Hypanus sabinus]